MARLYHQYNQTIAPAIQKKFGIANKMAVPKIDKIVINMGVGKATQDKSILEQAVDNLSKIAGQKPVTTKAKTSVAGFRLREGNPIGAKVTLRGARMFEFLDRLISIALPRVRDFRGVSARSFDGRGNYNFGVKEQIIFPEIQYDQVDKVRGMDITITTTAVDDKAGKALLTAFNFPFRK